MTPALFEDDGSTLLLDLIRTIIGFRARSAAASKLHAALSVHSHPGYRDSLSECKNYHTVSAG
jgi:hypothetical protein